MMRTGIISALLLVVAYPAYSQPTLQDQINAVDRVQQRNVDERIEAKQRWEAQRQDAERRQAMDQKLRAKTQAARQQKRDLETQAAKNRDLAYEDQLRQLELEDRKADLTSKQARVKRADEYVTMELGEKKAQADVIQSQADSNRNLTEGQKNLMNGMGQGAAKSSWFDRFTNAD